MKFAATMAVLLLVTQGARAKKTLSDTLADLAADVDTLLPHMATEMERGVEGNRLVLDGYEYMVMPDPGDGAPEGDFDRHDTKAFELPDGWEIVSRTDDDFDLVAEKVIGAYGWSAINLAVRKGAADGEGFSTIRTKNAGEPGAVASEVDRSIQCFDGWTSAQCFDGWSGQYRVTWEDTRLLLRRQARGPRGRALRPARRQQPQIHHEHDYAVRNHIPSTSSPPQVQV
jgi:hypothetical protein